MTGKKTNFRRGRGRPKGSKIKATARHLLFIQIITGTEDMMELVDGASNESRFVENREGSKPNRSGINMTENGSGISEQPMQWKDFDEWRFENRKKMG